MAFFCFIGCIYFLPTIITALSHRQSLRLVFGFNFFLGWTPIWFILLWHAFDPYASIYGRTPRSVMRRMERGKGKDDFNGPDTIRI